MIDELCMKQALQKYIDAFNQRDVAAITALYAEDATVEDPVGSPLKVGRAAIKSFYEMAIKSNAVLKLAAPIRASQGLEAAMAFDVQLTMPQGAAVIRVIDIMRFNDDGTFASMRALWGKTDMETAA